MKKIFLGIVFLFLSLSSIAQQINLGPTDVQVKGILSQANGGFGSNPNIPTNCGNSNNSLIWNNTTHQLGCNTFASVPGSVVTVSASSSYMFTLNVANPTTTPAITTTFGNTTNQIYVGNGSGTGSWQTVPNCSTTNYAIQYNNSTQIFSCGSISNSSGTNQTQSNKAILISSYTAGVGYVSPSFTVSGGTCTTPPTIGYDVMAVSIHGTVFPYISNPSTVSCTVAPSVAVNDSSGTGATVILEIQPSWATIDFLGNFNGNQTQNGGGQVVGAITPIITRPFLQDPTLEPIFATGNQGAYENIDCGGLGTSRNPWLNFSGSGTNYVMSVYNPCGSNISVSPFPQNSIYGIPSITFGQNYLNSGTISNSIIQINSASQTGIGFNGISYNPMIGTALALPQPSGDSYYLTNSGGLLGLGKGLGGGSGYTVPGTCSLAGAVISGSPATCSVSLGSGGQLNLSITNTTGSYGVPPILTIIGASGGSGATLSGYVGILNLNSITGSTWFDLAGAFHISSNAVGITGDDIFAINSSGASGSSTTGSGKLVLSSLLLPADTTITVGTTTINANSCGSPSTLSMTGLTSSMTATFTPSSDFHSVVGWNSSGSLYFFPIPTAGTLDYYVCNGTSSNLTPGTSTVWNVSAK